jgi:hypothetical protein
VRDAAERVLAALVVIMCVCDLKIFGQMKFV